MLDWFGDWSDEALFQVGSEFTRNTDLDDAEYRAPEFFPPGTLELPQPLSHRSAVVSSMVFVHNSIDDANKRLAKRTGRVNYLTPRHYLDFIKHFVTLLGEKRNDLEESQLHLNVGLQKLKETEEQVSTLQASLNAKNKELEAKNLLSQEKLKQMMADQRIAEQKQVQANELKGKIDVQNEEIKVRKARAEADLAKAEPAVLEAQKAVNSIKKSQLDEIRALGNPPAAVKNTLEAVCIMLGEKTAPPWAQIRKLMMDSNFIPSIVNFDSKKISAKQRQTLRDEYFSDPNFNFEMVNRASKACGPMIVWMSAQLAYSDILDRIQPLRNEVAALEAQADELKHKQAEITGTLEQLQASITRYTNEYAVLVSDAQEIKNEMIKVKTKVERSIALLQNLGSERGRWETESRHFHAQMATIVGDCMLTAAFLAYIGFFDQTVRASLMIKWNRHLESAGVKFRPDMNIIDYLSHPDERLQWQANALPADELCIENAILLTRFNRYPLVIDPSGQAAEFLLNQYVCMRALACCCASACVRIFLYTCLFFVYAGACL